MTTIARINWRKVMIWLLLLATVLVAAPRMVGVTAAGYGLHAIEYFTWYKDAEAYSGIALAVLEGLAVAMIISSVGELVNRSRFYGRILVFGTFALMAVLTFIVGTFMAAAGESKTISEAFSYTTFMVWSYIFAAMNPYTAFLLGVAEIAQNESRKVDTENGQKADRLSGLKAENQRLKTELKAIENSPKAIPENSRKVAKKAKAKATAKSAGKPTTSYPSPHPDAKADRLKVLENIYEINDGLTRKQFVKMAAESLELSKRTIENYISEIGLEFASEDGPEYQAFQAEIEAIVDPKTRDFFPESDAPKVDEIQLNGRQN